MTPLPGLVQVHPVPPAESAARPYPSYNTSPLEPHSPGMQSTAVQIASQITLGRNIGNTLKALGGETAWDNSTVSCGLIANRS